jgi:hypothetical protein
MASSRTVETVATPIQQAFLVTGDSLTALAERTAQVDRVITESSPLRSHALWSQRNDNAIFVPSILEFVCNITSTAGSLVRGYRRIVR